MPIIEEGDIPYYTLAQDVFPSEQGQCFVPFLGAGVSISGRKFKPDRKLTSPPPDRKEINNALDALRLSGKGRTFIELAILLGYLIELEDTETVFESPETFEQHLRNEPYPPSAGELAELFGLTAHYSTFEHIIKKLRRRFPDQLLSANEEEQVKSLHLLSRVTRIANPPEPLTSITSYYERLLGRKRLWNLLREIFETKKEPTFTHQLLAEAAKYHLDRPKATDYLIITTNYDCLMEEALDKLKVPYVVLTTRRGDDFKVLTRFASTIPNSEQLKEDFSDKFNPVDFNVSDELKDQPWAVIYKIHGCLSPEVKYVDDGVVISDNDYVSYVSKMGKTGTLIPAHVNKLMRDKPFWFLGYSLSDWNVRSIYQTLRRCSDPDEEGLPAYSVMATVGEFEKLFFEKNNITILEASLNQFVDGVISNLPKRIRECEFPAPPKT